mmetsp:Transcript_19528/g.35707  ORF Transcript_19528/g.35707 Transcript_19528/m.35707 type:complete len:328 (-) Transcript_19528:2994-3977(-)
MNRLRLLNATEYLTAANSWRTGKFEGDVGYLALYSSHLDAIVTDPTLMLIPFDDHMGIRGHAVFDTCTIFNGNAYLLDRHINRLLDSATKARIELPMTPEAIKEKILDVVAASNAQTCGVRMYLSAGPGNVGIAPVKGASCLYIMVHTKAITHASVPKEYTVRTPVKPAFLATMKSTNYLLNALTAMESQEKGGRFGVCVDEEDQLLESCVCSVGFVLPGNKLVTPTFDRILTGLTMQHVLELAEQLVEEGTLTSIEQRSISLAEAKTCTEMFLTAADSIYPVLSWDDVEVGGGERGPVISRLIEVIKADIGGKSRELTPVPYAKYH